MILPLSVVLLATFDYIHANQCSTELENYMRMKCTSSTSSKLTFVALSDCTFTCQGENSAGQKQITKLNLWNGLPCGPCKECCDGICTPVKFSSQNQLTLKSCPK
uniref:Putative ixostatin n=1 Tax=Ixodes ricinus TaxID=34613 RepID=A0A0K8RCQ2_IXORI